MIAPSYLREIDLSGTSIDSSGLDALAQIAWPRLEVLKLARTSTGDNEMESLAKLSSLNVLNLSDTRVTDAGITRLAAKSSGWSINVLHMDRTRIGDEGLRALFAKISPSDLERLSISGTNVTWEYINTWKSAPEMLCLGGLDIDDRAANWFVEQGGTCREADLSDTRLTDTGLADLESCESLRKLCVKGCAISDSVAIHFMKGSAATPPLRLNSSWSSPKPLADRIRAYRETGWLERSGGFFEGGPN
jgi:hypothetical protein